MNALTLQYYGQFPYVPGISGNAAFFSMNDQIIGLKVNFRPEKPRGHQKIMIIIFERLIFVSNMSHAEKAF
jgi:hypothetical protein